MKDQAASDLANKRWAKTTVAQRKAWGKKLTAARKAKAQKGEGK